MVCKGNSKGNHMCLPSAYIRALLKGPQASVGERKSRCGQRCLGLPLQGVLLLCPRPALWNDH